MLDFDAGYALGQLAQRLKIAGAIDAVPAPISARTEYSDNIHGMAADAGFVVEERPSIFNEFNEFVFHRI